MKESFWTWYRRILLESRRMFKAWGHDWSGWIPLVVAIVSVVAGILGRIFDANEVGNWLITIGTGLIVIWGLVFNPLRLAYKDHSQDQESLCSLESKLAESRSTFPMFWSGRWQITDEDGHVFFITLRITPTGKHEAEKSEPHDKGGIWEILGDGCLLGNKVKISWSKEPWKDVIWLDNGIFRKTAHRSFFEDPPANRGIAVKQDATDL